MSIGPVTRVEIERRTGISGLASRRDWCIHVDPHDHVRGPGGQLMIPSIIFRNDPTRYHLDGRSPDARQPDPLYWGGNIESAQAICRRKNAEIGVSMDDYIDILVSHIKPSASRQPKAVPAAGLGRDPVVFAPRPARIDILDSALAEAMAEAEILAGNHDPEEDAGPSP